MLSLNMILARADDGTIGHLGGIQWQLPPDMAAFKRRTMGHAVIMGRRTWESLPDVVRPLPGRRNIVVSKTLRFDDLPDGVPPPCAVHGSLSAALFAARWTDTEPFIIGGSRLYTEALPLATRIYLTEVHLCPRGDTRFDFDRSAWQETERRAGHHSGIRYTFVTLERVAQ